MDIMKLNSAETEALVLKNLKHQSMKSTIYLNGEFLIVYMNKAAEDLFGWKSDELRGKSLDVLKVENLSKQIKDNIKNVLKNGGSYSLESTSEKKKEPHFFVS